MAEFVRKCLKRILKKDGFWNKYVSFNFLYLFIYDGIPPNWKNNDVVLKRKPWLIAKNGEKDS